MRTRVRTNMFNSALMVMIWFSLLLLCLLNISRIVMSTISRVAPTQVTASKVPPPTTKCCRWSQTESPGARFSLDRCKKRHEMGSKPAWYPCFLKELMFMYDSDAHKIMYGKKMSISWRFDSWPCSLPILTKGHPQPSETTASDRAAAATFATDQIRRVNSWNSGFQALFHPLLPLDKP